jgi:hypothetical protein
MPSYGQSVTLQYVAWDTVNNVGKTGDAGNHTLKWVKDGTAATPTNVPPAEVDSTNCPGVYKLTMTGTEASCQVGTLCGKSSTAGIVILPATVTFENLPSASPGASGGLPTLTSALVVGADLQTIKTQAVTAAGAVTFPSSIGTSSYAGADTSGTTTLLTRIPGAITLNGGNVACDLQTIKTQAVTCTAGVTVNPNVGGVQPFNFSGTGASAVLKADVEQINTQAVTAGGPVTVNSQVGEAYEIATDSSGRVLLQPTQTGVTIPTVTSVTTANLNLAQAIPTSNAAQTVGDALNAARAQGFGKWTLSGTTLTLYAGDGTTVVRTFTLDSSSSPTQRT